MPIYPTDPPALLRSCISFGRYAFLTGYSECAIMGVFNPTDPFGDCENPIWFQSQRDMLNYYLAEAQAEIEQVINYPLCPTYIAAEELPYQFPIHTRWTKIIEPGQRAESIIASVSVISYATEPATIGPIATTVTDVNEVRIFYPNSDREIEARRVTITGGNVTIQIPKCRLVAANALDTPEGGLDYADAANFLTTVDIKRVYTDNSVNAQMVWLHRNSAGDCPQCGCLRCGEHTEDVCLTVHNPNTGALAGLRATYSVGVWTPFCSHCYSSAANLIRVYYKAGLQVTDLIAENAVLRLAHAKMPTAICGCSVLKSMWERDNRIPEFLTRERENCPFGMSDGAWTAWKFANALALRRMNVFG